ncbi:DUF3081 domain-containing protein [Saccharobesus litoralis]|uniref:DUF3081 domain-containing protein n=1 Tax=Saccharobesus litoralis TaxID=2172099 RepID=A0A2S0VQH2_9ALTE|nr:DUF3081 family protein [Saccharobesus litoralis]AWB66465.1 DUF3081 domain-containing protein [Saccharobesus litoralis]
MKNQLDVSGLLAAFNKISQYGQRTESGYKLDGIEASSDFDGYTVYLSDGVSQLTVFFHNKYQLDTPDNAASERLLNKLTYIQTHEY